MRVLAGALLLLAGCTVSASEVDLTVSAASSLTDVLAEAIEAWHAEPWRTRVRPEFAASSTLARQIEFGARRDVFLSADHEWAEHVREHAATESSPVVVARNELVLVDAESRGGSGRWTTADPSHVPLGVYAKHWLEREGTWDALELTLVRAKDARAALRLVERGEVDRAVLYSSDASTSDALRIVQRADDVAVEIVGVALSEPGGSFLEWLASDECAPIWRAHGFLPPAPR